MSVEIRSGDLTDPLNGYSISLLLPRTLKDLKPTENPKFDELPSYFKSLVSKNSHNLLEQVKTIRKGSSEFHKTEIQHSMQSEDEFIDVPALAKDRPQARRPALSTKRARFSMKPIISQPSLVEDMSFNVDQLKDPEELFSAFESHERAKEELQKQGGDVSVYSSQHMLSTTARRRRPRIREGKVSYKHRYSSESADHSESFLTSQGTFNVDISSPSYRVPKIDAAYQLGASQEGDASGVQDSIAEAESRLGGSLDLERLLSDNGTDLDGDGAVSFLNKHLKLQPIQSGNISAAELDSLCNNPLTRPRTPFSDIHNVVTGVKTKRHIEAHQHGEISANLLASRITSKSPLLSLQKLKRDACQKSDPFSFRGIDGLALSSNLDDSHDTTIDPTPAEVTGSGLSFSGKLQSLMAGKGMNVQRTMDIGQTATKELPRALDAIDVDSSDILMDPRPKRSYIPFTDKDEDLQKGTMALSGYSDLVVGKSHAEEGHDDIIVPEENTQIHQETPTVSSGEESKQNVPTRTERKRKNVSSRKSPSDNSSSAAGTNNAEEGNLTIDVNVPEDNNEAQQTPLVSSSFKNKLKAPARSGRKRTNLMDKKSMADKSDGAAGEKCADGEYSEASVICPDQNNETLQEPTVTLLSVETKKKASARIGRRRRELVHRKSLEGAGTAWQSGVRRSTRKRSRPLQYWKGERFLYGRVHESLLTVIGLKYESPAKPSGEPTFKVKYFVSDEYKQLVDSQALH